MFNLNTLEDIFKFVLEDERMITFEPLWETLKAKNITIYDLIYHYKMSRGMLDNLKHDRSVTLNTLNDLCNMFKCGVTDVIKYTEDED